MIKSFHNRPLVRTRFTLFTGSLSESAYHSDSFHFIYRKPVRISLSFRLVSLYLQEACPNQPIIQTRFTLFTGSLSESAYHSDSFHFIYRKPVRISLSFRLVSLYLQDSCPNQPIIQTRFTLFTGSLSESAYHSDSFHFIYRKPVRISLSFRLVSLYLQDCCPNQLIIRTRFTLFTGLPSESDLSFGLKFP